jgi:hypothetical protein
MNRILSTVLVFTLAVSLARAEMPAGQTTSGTDRFSEDVSALCSEPHRTAGSPQGRKSMEYIGQRLKDMGVKDVLTLDVPVWTLETVRCHITIDSVTVPLEMMRPNLSLAPVTGPDGIRGPMFYAGNGSMIEYGTRDCSGAIVVLEYESGEAWRHAFSLGAAAVIFIGNAENPSLHPLHIDIPANLVRLYAPNSVTDKIDFRADYPDVKVVSHARWVKSSACNVIAFLPGTNPVFSADRHEPEMVVLSVSLDTWGEAPFVINGARAAANAAALLEAVEYFRNNRPRRDVVFAFFDAHQSYHEGARRFYDALIRKDKLSSQLWDEHKQEKIHIEKLMAAFSEEKQILDGTSSRRELVVRYLMNEAENRYTDLSQELISLRMRKSEQEKASESFIRQASQIESRMNDWNKVLGILDKGNTAGIECVWPELSGICEKKLKTSYSLISEQTVIDEQERKISELLGKRYVVLHASYDFSGEGPCWGPVVGRDDFLRSFYAAPSSDNAGFYGSVFKALRNCAGSTRGLNHLKREVLKDPLVTAQYVPGRFTNECHVAGIYGIYNMAMVTYHDARPRDGHPSDIIQNLSLSSLREHAREATRLVHKLSQTGDISLQRVFSDLSSSRYPRWTAGHSTGYYAGLKVSGSLSEDRPASDAVVTMWPRSTGVWGDHDADRLIPGFSRFVTARVDANGRFGLVSVRGDQFAEFDGGMTVLSVVFDTLGTVTAITNTTTLGNMLANNLFPARSFQTPMPLNGLTEQTKILRSASDATFRPDRSLCDAFEQFSFMFVHPQELDGRVKIFQPYGTVLLGKPSGTNTGSGYSFDSIQGLVRVNEATPVDMWLLNEGRLSILRSKGVMSVDIELLHDRARRLFEKGEKLDSTAMRAAAFAQSGEISRLVYMPVRLVMDDLIRAVVILLLLAIPFAFALERLLVCATSVYTRLLGFAVAFLITFILMYFMHPGFQIASTPVIVFLAFMIILLTSLVIYIMMRKFRVELMAFQGRAASVHSSEISRTGTMIAAVNMGMSTMRRRPVRTFLTCITVIMLTFTILCFSSFSSKLGIRKFYEGPASADMKASFFIRRLDYSKLAPDIMDIIRGMEGNGGLAAAQWWKVKVTREDTPLGVSRVDSASEIFVSGLLGLSPAELSFRKDICVVFDGDSDSSKAALLKSGGVFLPSIMKDYLSLKPGDALIVNGRRMFFAGSFDGNRLQRMKNLDGKSVMPVDFQDVTYKPVTVERTTSSATMTGGVAEMAQRDFMRLSANQIAIMSDAELARQGGRPHTISVYAGEGVNTSEEGARLAELTSLPVWTRGDEGIQRMVFTRIAEVSGGFAIFIPVVLGGLIIFGTLLGSITDRQREIYTFSALGLSPGHVGFLFFAEAAVYAIVGGVGGMLLAQALGLAASFLAQAGYIQQASINFSSTNSLSAIAIVMGTVLVSAIYPAIKASASANPGVQRTWKMPDPIGDILEMTFPFTVSAYDITGVVSFLSEHFNEHSDAGFGLFAATGVKISRNPDSGNMVLDAHVSLAPFDLGIAQKFSITAVHSEIPGIDEVLVRAVRTSGSLPDWKRANKVFIRDLRKQFLLWRTLSHDLIEQYRMRTLTELGGSD